MHRTLIALALTAVFSASAFAQNAATETQRDTNQQNRVEQGLKSGQLTTKEAGQLERDEQLIDRTQAHDMKDGTLSAQEKAQIQREQNRASRQIDQDKHNAATGNPASKSSERMQADVQRNANQQARINQGVRSGQLTNKEAGSLEGGQAHVDRSEANAARNGRVSAREQARTQGKENRQNGHVYRKKHNDATRDD
ncbi:MAG: hypothetical protein DYH18_04335 [Xanthomonadales bacterium PRO7]|nr:hypothetical protein [Xanthomonadales bacterium PRO7]HMM56481.1 hypothetical protein [Rudaea sp.]